MFAAPSGASANETWNMESRRHFVHIFASRVCPPPQPHFHHGLAATHATGWVAILERAYPCHIKAPMRKHEQLWRRVTDSPPSQTVHSHPTALAWSCIVCADHIAGTLPLVAWAKHSSTAASRTRCSQRAKCCQPPSPHQRMPPSSSLQPRQPGATPRPTPLPQTQPSCPVSRAAVRLGPPDAVALPDTLARGESPRPERRWTRCTHRHHTLAHTGATCSRARRDSPWLIAARGDCLFSTSLSLRKKSRFFLPSRKSLPHFVIHPCEGEEGETPPDASARCQSTQACAAPHQRAARPCALCRALSPLRCWGGHGPAPEDASRVRVARLNTSRAHRGRAGWQRRRVPDQDHE